MKILPSTNRYLRLTKYLVGMMLDSCLYFDHLLSKRDSLIEINYPARFIPSSHDRLIVFARFSNSDELLSNEWDLLNLLSKKNSHIIVVSNSPINSGDIARLTDVPHLGVIIRRNIGRDFGAYKDVLKSGILLDRYDSLLFINNSMHWDCQKLDLILDSKIDRHNCDILGLTDSFQRSYHLQSYFIYFNGPKWHKFLEDESNIWKNWHFKRSIVEYGERGLSKRALKCGLNLDAIYPYSELVVQSKDLDYLSCFQEKRINLNPTQHFWETLKTNSFPGVKISLLNSNPARLPRTPDDPRSLS